MNTLLKSEKQPSGRGVVTLREGTAEGGRSSEGHLDPFQSKKKS